MINIERIDNENTEFYKDFITRVTAAEESEGIYADLCEGIKTDSAAAYAALTDGEISAVCIGFLKSFRNDFKRVYIVPVCEKNVFCDYDIFEKLFKAIEDESIIKGMNTMYLKTENFDFEPRVFIEKMGYNEERIQLSAELNVKNSLSDARLLSADEILENKEVLIKLIQINTRAHFDLENYSVLEAGGDFDNMYNFVLDNKAMVFGSFDGQKLIGFCWVFPSFYMGNAIYSINAICVLPKYRKHNIATDLFQKMISVLYGGHIKRLNVWCDTENTKAVSFYIKQGMKPVSYQLVKRI